MTREEAINEIKSWDFLEGKEIEAIHTLVPELKESEDDRIIKKLQEYVKNRNWPLNGPTQAEVLAWLEKQKECVADSSKTSANEDESIRKFLVDYFASYKIGNVTTKLNGVRIDDILNYLEKQKETLHILEMCKENANSFTDGVIEVRSFQRGMEEGRRLEKKDLDKMIVVSPEVWDNAISDAFENGKKEGEKQKEQKPAEWSEEDEDMLNSCISSIEEAKENRYAYKETDGDTSYDHEIAWLKSLPERFNLQPKKELSIKKAIQWLDDTFCFLDNSSGRGRDCEITTHDFDSLEEMYDSFRKAVIVDSEPHWKPSENQMSMLLAVVNDPNNAGSASCHLSLESLYNDLKKL